MKVNIVCFELFFGKGIGLKDLFQYLYGINGKQIAFGKYERRLYVGEKPEFYTGLFMTVKQNKKFCQFAQSQGDIKISVADIGKNNNMFEFNMFLIHKKTRRCYYMTYHVAASANQFCMYLRDRFDALKRKSLVNLASQGIDEEEAQDRLSGRLYWEHLLKKDDFDKAIQELDQIKSLKLNIRTYVPKKTKLNLTPQRPLVKAETHSYTYDRVNPKANILDDVRAKVRAVRPKSGRVIGLIDGLEKIVNLIEVPSSFGEYKFDDVAVHMNFEASKFNDSLVIEELLKVAADNQAMTEFEEG